MKRSKAEERKIFEVKIGTRKWNGAKFSVQGEKQLKKWNTKIGDVRVGSHPAKFPTC